jgi:hypothetical protein
MPSSGSGPGAPDAMPSGGPDSGMQDAMPSRATSILQGPDHDRTSAKHKQTDWYEYLAQILLLRTGKCYLDCALRRRWVAIDRDGSVKTDQSDSW